MRRPDASPVEEPQEKELTRLRAQTLEPAPDDAQRDDPSALLPLRPVALVLSSYNPLYAVEAARHPDWLVAPGVLAPNGPRPAAPVAQPPIPTGPTTVPQGVVLGAGTLVALTLIGVGWAAALLPAGVRPFEALALSPAFGVAFLLLAGVAWDAFGLRLTGMSGALVPVVTAAVGGGAALARLRQVGAGGRADPRGPGPEGDAPSAPA